MKIKLTLSVLLVAIGGLLVGANAQRDTTDLLKKLEQYPKAQQRAMIITNRMNEKLVLDDAQQDQLYKVNLKYAIRNDSIVRGGWPEVEMQKQLENAWVAREAEYKRILTADQYMEYEYIKADLRAKAEAKAEKAQQEKAQQEKQKQEQEKQQKTKKSTKKKASKSKKQ